MNRVLPPTTSWPLFDVERTRAIEQREIAHLPPHALMRRAGLATAKLALAITPHAGRVWIAAGPGNNGGDGFEAAIHLARWGRHVDVALFGDAAALPSDARDALARALAAGVHVDTAGASPTHTPELAIDALLGIGACRAPQGPLLDAIECINKLRCSVLAIDLPSGLHADTGQTLGPACVIATHTLALLTLKPGLFTGSGRDHAGTVWIDTLGVDTRGEPAAATLPGPAVARSPARRHAQHKGSFGDVAVVGGAPGMTGAALLAARAAHAAGAGRVFVSLLGAPVAGIDTTQPELMFRSDWAQGDAQQLKSATVVCGCGGGEAVREVLPRLLSLVPRLLIDADALNAIAADTMLQPLLRARAERGHATVLTPHPLEAARLLSLTTHEVQANRLAAAHSLADRYRCTVVLKGSGSVVAAFGQPTSINPTGNAALASAGTGDVLAGWIGGLWSQADQAEPAQVARSVAIAGVFMHGAAADLVACGPLRASNLIERMHTQRDATSGLTKP